jgi:uncharacterized protein
VDSRLKRLEELLNEKYQGEFDYIFKFVVPQASLAQLKNLLNNPECSEKVSKNGNYISVTLTLRVDCAATVVEVYQRVSCVKGLIAL